MITSSSAGTGMWLSLAVLAKLAAFFGDHRPVTIDRVPGEATVTSPQPFRARLLHQGRVIALVHDEQLAVALMALLDAVPRSLGTFAATCVELLRQHSTDMHGRCVECGQPAPCGTRTLLQDRIGAQSIAPQPGHTTDRP